MFTLTMKTTYRSYISKFRSNFGVDPIDVVNEEVFPRMESPYISDLDLGGDIEGE